MIAPIIALVVSLLAAGGSAFWMWWRYAHPWRPDPKDYPSVIVSLSPGQTGAFPLMVINGSGAPFVNLSLTTRIAGLLLRDSTSNRIGDIEPGITPVPGSVLLPGYYQIYVRYRGGWVTQMLLITSVKGRTQQFIWRSTPEFKIDEPKGEHPFLGIYGFDEPPGLTAKSFKVLSVSLVTGVADTGLVISGISVLTQSLSAQSETQISPLTLRIGDSETVFASPTAPSNALKGSGAIYEWPVMRFIPAGTKDFGVSFTLHGRDLPNGQPETLQANFTYKIDWAALSDGRAGVSQHVMTATEKKP